MRHKKGIKDFTSVTVTRSAVNERSELLEDIYYLEQDLVEIRAQLGSFFSTLACITIVPACLAMAMRRGILPYFGSAPSRQKIMLDISKDLRKSPQVNFQFEAYETATVLVDNLESELLRNAKLFAEEKPGFSRVVGIIGVDEKSWPFPWRFNEIPALGDQHLLFKMAELSDLGFRYIKAFPESFRPIFNTFKRGYEFTLTAILAVTPQIMQALEQEILFPEFSKNYHFNSDNITVQRFAEIFRFSYPKFISYGPPLAGEINRVTDEFEAYINRTILIFNVVVFSWHAKSLVINPLLKKFFPLNWCLKEPLKNKKNYQQQSLESLHEEKQKLTAARQQLHLPATRAQTSNRWLHGILFVIGLVYLFGILDTPFFYLPFWLCAFGEQGFNALKQKYDQMSLEKSLKNLKDQINVIAGSASTCLEINLVNKKKLAFSYLTITVKTKYQNLPTEYLANLLKITVNRFGINLIPSYSKTRFSLPAESSFKKINVITQFFSTLLEHSLQAYLLEKQINKIFAAILKKGFSVDLDKQVIMDNESLTQCVFLISNLAELTSIQPILDQLGFEKKEGQVILSKKNVYFHEEIKNIKLAITQLPSPQTSLVESNVLENKLVEQPQPPRHRARPIEQAPDAPLPAMEIQEQKTIKWPCGAVFPSRNVNKVSGGINEYIFWNLSPANFNDDKNAHKLFEQTSKQKAKRGHDAQGIKIRPTIAERSLSKGQRLFPARVKRLGEHGDDAVLLDIEKQIVKSESKQEGCATLYIARSYQSGGIH